jgi:amidohydrolase
MLLILCFPGLVQSKQSELALAIDAAVEQHAAATIELRHRIHRHPELGNREFETAKLIAAHLRSLGMEVQTGVAHTGVVGILKGGKAASGGGAVVAVRADIDALPVVEETNLPFKSTVRTTYLGQEVGVMHACGHDIHTAVQLGVASVLASIKDDLPGTVKFIFQPAEEGTPGKENGGASMMVEEGVLSDPAPEVIFGLHSFPDIEVGQVGYTIGPAMASVDHFRIEIKGVQSHGARPEESVDPVVMAAQVVSAFQTIRSRNLPPDAPSVITVGIINGGQRFNIIPRQVHLEGTVRTYSREIQDTIERRMREICDGITRAGGGTFEFDYERVTPSMSNDPALSRQMIPSLEKACGESNVFELPPVMGGEDFSEFSNRIPGFYYRLGTTKPGTTSGGVHTPTFTADDGAVVTGMKVM